MFKFSHDRINAWLDPNNIQNIFYIDFIKESFY